MARTRDRIFALVMAVTFFIATVGVGLGVLWQIRQDGRERSSLESATDSDVSTQDNANSSKGKKMEDFTPIAKVEKLEAIDMKEGTGEAVKPGDAVTVDYTGAIASTGVVFESSKDTGQPAFLTLDRVIDGWAEGLPGMKIGGKRRLLIPAEKAYGANPPQGIPVNADLVFDIELHKIGE